MLTVRNVSHDPFYNQAFEEYIYQTYLDDDIFLLWQNAPAVVVGSYQNICREVHVEALRQRGIPVVRRISGGGTVYHDLGNVNYTYIVRAGALDYDAVLSPVIAALNAIGVPARKNRTCDIAIGDLKISGSAQRMTKGRLLHHGTLLFSSDLGVLDQITTHRKNDCFQSRGTQSAICTVTNIREHLASPMTIEEFQNRLLEQMVPPGSPRLTLTAEQEAEVCRCGTRSTEAGSGRGARRPPSPTRSPGNSTARLSASPTKPSAVSFQARSSTAMLSTARWRRSC